MKVLQLRFLLTCALWVCAKAIAQDAGASGASVTAAQAPGTASTSAVLAPSASGTNRLENAPGTVTIRAPDGINLVVQLSDELSIPEPLQVVVEVRNTDASRALSIEALTVRPFGRLDGFYLPAALGGNKEVRIEPTRSSPRYFGKLPVNTERSVWDHIHARSGPADFEIELKYSMSGQDKPSIIALPVKLNVMTSNVYVYVGGLCGAVLLVSFMLTTKVLKQAQAGVLIGTILRWKHVGLKWSVLFVAYALNGFVVALLLVILSAGLTALALPIDIKLQDFSGGVVVGLFSVTLGKFIAEKLNLA